MGRKRKQDHYTVWEWMPDEGAWVARGGGSSRLAQYLTAEFVAVFPEHRFKVTLDDPEGNPCPPADSGKKGDCDA